MKRDLRLQGLSSDHHRALVLARRIRRACADDTADAAFIETVWAAYRDELQPHFDIEERLLLPALRAAGCAEVAVRTDAEHAALRDLVNRSRAGDAEALDEFGALLAAHVRFEERELFPLSEQKVSVAVLDAVAAEAPAPNADGGGGAASGTD